MILKKGQKNEMVRILQEFLNIEADGIFGNDTEKAVIKWQKANNLKPDGVVGKNTWMAMGIATTDVSENSTGTLNIINHFLPDNEYMKGTVDKKWLFLHHTAGWNSPYQTIDIWAKDNRVPVGTEFVIGGQRICNKQNEHDGVVLKAFPDNGYGWHLGTGNNTMHRESVGIEICNFGQLTKGGYKKGDTWVQGNKDSFYTYVGGVVNSEQIIKLSKPFRGFEYWHKYSDKQIEVLEKLIIYISNRNNINIKEGIPKLIKEKGESAFDICDVKMCENSKSLWLHTNVQRGKFDLFPQPNLVEMLRSLH